MKFNFNILDMNIETVLVIFLILGLIISFNNVEGYDLQKSKLKYTKQTPKDTSGGLTCSNHTGDDPTPCEKNCEANDKCKNYYWYPASRVKLMVEKLDVV